MLGEQPSRPWKSVSEGKEGISLLILVCALIFWGCEHLVLGFHHVAMSQLPTSVRGCHENEPSPATVWWVDV